MIRRGNCKWLVVSPSSELLCIMGGMVPCGFAGDIEKCPCRSYKGYDDSIEMLVSEIYPAISGEGLSTGRVCTIVRTVGCGLRCSYCDSVYAYDGGQKIALRDVLAMVLKYGIRMVLFTGGEPLLDEKVAGNFLRAMLENQIVTYVETNGAMDIRPFKLLAHIVMDIKTPSSGMHGRMNWNNIFYMGVTDEVKFVVSDEEDYNYAKQVMSKYKLDQITPNIFMSPVWGSDSDMSFVQALSNWMIQDKSEARLMLQQHKCIWGPKRRGV